MKFCSTRNRSYFATFKTVLFDGLAPDGGLYVPCEIPSVDSSTLLRWQNLSYQELAVEILSLFIGDEIPVSDIKSLVRKSYQTFRHSEICPTQKIQEKIYVLELFHGPTYAFKDVALQMLGNLFEYFLAREEDPRRKNLTVIAATSGDTGSAAIHGLSGKKHVECFVLFPEGRVSPVQEKQMTTCADPNVHCLSIKGSFDDAQRIVKSIFRDGEYRKRVNLGAVNSINFARILSQIVYYFYSFFRVTGLGSSSKKIIYSVPTGNFGDVLAGFYAKQMGLPIEKLIVATNSNDILHNFFQNGIYRSKPVVSTLSPSMDISVSSNFERFLFWLCGGNSDQVCAWFEKFETGGEIRVSEELLSRARTQIISQSKTDDELLECIRQTFRETNYLVCPHTACSFPKQTLTLPSCAYVCLATAHWGKFKEAIDDSLGGSHPQLGDFVDLEELPTRKTIVEADRTKVMHTIDGLRRF